MSARLSRLGAHATTTLALGLALAHAAHAQTDPRAPAASEPAAVTDTQAESATPELAQPVTPELERPATPELTQASQALAAQADAEIAALLADSAPATHAPSETPSLSLYGFGDFSVTKAFPNHRIGVFPPKQAIMSIGNVNVYAGADLTHGVSSLLEVRFTFLPNGSFDLNSLQSVSTNAFDYADWNRVTQWGGVILERFHLDYSYHDLLNLRMGLWLTPYGIWNVDHGSPTVIPVIKPYVIGETLFPTRQMGFQLFGSTLLGSVTVGYMVSLSNGRGELQQLDLDDNKAIGTRLYLSYAGFGTLTVGASSYVGQATREPNYVVTPGNPPLINVRSDDSFKELSFAADLLWEWRDLRIQAEVIAQQVAYRDGARKLASGFGTSSGFVPDHTAWGTYALVSYRLPWLNISPYAIVEKFDRGYAESELLLFGGNTVNVMAMRAGLNVRPIPALALKLQYSHIWFPGVSLAGTNGERIEINMPNLSFQAAWAF